MVAELLTIWMIFGFVGALGLIYYFLEFERKPFKISKCIDSALILSGMGPILFITILALLSSDNLKIEMSILWTREKAPIPSWRKTILIYSIGIIEFFAFVSVWMLQLRQS